MIVTVKGEFLELREIDIPARKNGNGEESKAKKITLARLFSRSGAEVIEYQPMKGQAVPAAGKEIEVKLRLRAYLGRNGAAIGAEQV